MKNPLQLFYPIGLILSVASASAWTPGQYTSPMPSKGFTVDNSVRNDVLSFWHAVYMASEGYQNRINWTGSHTVSNHNTGTGTVSELFVRDVERRLNFHRALAGAPADASVNSGSTIIVSQSDAYEADPSVTKGAANQRSAYMIARSYIANDETDGASHNPPSNTIGWNEAAWNANARSNLTYGYYGPGAIDAYMNENDAGTTAADNSMIKHRRWSLYQRATDYGTGDTPGKYVQGESRVWAPTNSLYVWQKAEELSDAAPRFVTYPAAGFFPAPLNTKFWSVSYPGADFSDATLVMRTASNSLPSITRIATPPNGGPGDSSLVWQVNSSAHTTTEAPTDRTYRITVTGIRGEGVPSSIDYTVTLFDPDNFTDDQSLTGTDAPPAAGIANYHFARPRASDKVAVDVFTASSAAWTETAETSAATTVVNQLYTSGDPTNPYTPYTFQTNAISPLTTINSGGNSRMFRLSHPVRWDILAGGVPDEIFELSREILTVPSATSNVTFKYKRGYMTINSKLVVEYTQNDGASWTQLGNAITGKSTSINTLNDSSTQTWTGTLPQSSEPYRIRFRFYRDNVSGSNILVHTENSSAATGIFLDDITTANCQWLELKKSNEIPQDSSRFTFSADSAGTALTGGSQHRLRMRTMLGGKWFQYGPAKIVTVTSSPTPGFGGWTEYEYPTLAGGFDGDDDGDGIPNSLEYAFQFDPLSPEAIAGDTIAFPTALPKDAQDPYLSISRPANGIRDGVTAEWSDTLAPDSWSTEGVTLTFDADAKTATAFVPAGTGKRFVRWKVTTP